MEHGRTSLIVGMAKVHAIGIGPLWKHPDFYNSQGGRPPHFLNQDTGITALGNRLFLRSVAHLYALGDPAVPYDGPSRR
jgi:hypothetical protein